MKLILSRKGFDFSSGGAPSPIFPDGRILSLPIPEQCKWATPDYHITYADLSWPGQPSVAEVAEQLTHGRRSPVRGRCRVHVDPDIYEGSLPREHGWQPIFGQSDAAQAHLDNQGIGCGDLFLFFGLFGDVDMADSGLRFSPASGPRHVIFGWLQVQEVVKIPSESASMTWMLYHPHAHSPLYAHNTLYVASHGLTFDADRPGAGLFDRYCKKLRLTAEHCTASRWLLPHWFSPEGGKQPLTYHHSADRWEPGEHGVLLKSVGRGQEFVLDCAEYPQAPDWLSDLFRNAPPTRTALKSPGII